LRNHEHNGVEQLTMPELQPGTLILGRYQILRKIGQGGFAEVYLALHQQQQTLLALKVIRRDAPGMGERVFRESRERFEIEARLGEKLNHPHIVRAFDFGREGEQYFLASDFASGGSLQDRLAQGPLSVAQVVRIALGLAAGLAAIHDLDVVHRDLKPSNILFSAQGTAQIADLGLAQLPGGVSMRSFLGSELPGAAHPGTRAYMSPEQETTSGYLKPASDVYSLGIIFFEMLTGRNVKNLPPGLTLKMFRPDVPAWLEDLIHRMLAEAPQERPWNGGQVLLELQNGLQPAAAIVAPTEPRPSPPPGAAATPPKAGQPAKRRLLFLIPAALLLMGLGIGLAALFTNPPGATGAQTSGNPTGSGQRVGAGDVVIEYLVSSANSMLQSWDGQSKQEAVQVGLADHWANFTGADAGVGFILRVFGSQYNAADSLASCRDTQLLAGPVSQPEGFAALLSRTEARGLTPLAEALYAALGDFGPQQKKRLVLITDSGDTCGQDPCIWAVTQYRDAGVVMPIDVLDLGGNSQLDCLSTESGGQYFSIQNYAELTQALQQIQQGIHP